jgi:hypothetical protein
MDPGFTQGLAERSTKQDTALRQYVTARFVAKIAGTPTLFANIRHLMWKLREGYRNHPVENKNQAAGGAGTTPRDNTLESFRQVLALESL